MALESLEGGSDSTVVYHLITIVIMRTIIMYMIMMRVIMIIMRIIMNMVMKIKSAIDLGLYKFHYCELFF